jgi:hypothetical protein
VEGAAWKAPSLPRTSDFFASPSHTRKHGMNVPASVVVCHTIGERTENSHMPQQGPGQAIGELAKAGDLVFARASQHHRFGRVIEVTTAHVIYRSIPTEREIVIPAHWAAFWNVTDRGCCLVVQAPV